jgi:hypothetical protein
MSDSHAKLSLSKSGLTIVATTVVLCGLIIGIGRASHSLAAVTDDLNGDGVVNSLDLGILSNAYGTTGGTADINKDGQVNMLDLSLFLHQYQPGGATTPTNTYTIDSLLTKPFNDQSLWNRKVPTNQAFASASALPAGWASANGVININSYTQPIYFTDSSKYPVKSFAVPCSWNWPADPLPPPKSDGTPGDCSKTTPGTPKGIVKLALQPDAHGGTGSDGSMVVVDIPSHTVYHFWKATDTDADGNILPYFTVSAYAHTDLSATGWSIDTLANGKKQGAGIAAVGANYLGGNITGVSLSKGVIDHSLALSLPDKFLTNAAPSYVGQATNTDACSNIPTFGPCATSNGLREGQQLAIPRSTPKPTNLTPYGSILWDAMVNYGAWVVDQDKNNIAFFDDSNSVTTAQHDALKTVNSVSGDTNSDIYRITHALRPLSPAY